jgi:hypothetical protein
LARKFCRRCSRRQQRAYLLGTTGRRELPTPTTTQSADNGATWGWMRRRRERVWYKGVLIYALRPIAKRAQVGQREDKGGRARCPARRIGGQNLGHGWVGPPESVCLHRPARVCAGCPSVRVDRNGHARTGWVEPLDMPLCSSRVVRSSNVNFLFLNNVLIFFLLSTNNISLLLDKIITWLIRKPEKDFL